MSTPPNPNPPADPAPTPGSGPTPVADPPKDPATEPAPATGADDPPLGPAGEKALAEWKKRAKEAEKTATDQAARLKTFEDAQKTETERLADQVKDAETRAEQATRLAVASKVEALATGKFADPSDAVEALAAGKFVTDAGQVDAAGITAALDELLARKPHWKAAAGPRIPAPDPSQGARPGEPPSLDQRIAEAQQKGNTRLAISLKSQQLRELSTKK